MRRKIKQRFLHQTQIAGHISGRDVPRRVVTALLMVGVCQLSGFGWQGLIAGFCILCLEGVSYPLNRRASQFENRLGLPMAIAIFGANWFAMLSFLSFSVILSQGDALPFVLAGYIWAFGIFVHISNSFALLPLFNWSQMIPASGAVFWMLWNLSQNPVYETQAVYWVMIAVLTGVYIFSTFDTMNRQKATRLALERAQQKANLRMVELERLSRTDSLTGLMNRRAFDEIAQSMMNQHANKQGVTVFSIDLDGFKPINDSYGHDAGDAVLCTVADRLQKVADQDDWVARVGGDEFSVLTARVTSVTQAHQFAARISALLADAIPYNQKLLNVGISIGIARQGPDANTPTELLSQADQAMYLAKQDRDTQVKIYNKAAFPVRPTPQDRLTLLDAMERGQILPHYQPKIHLDTGEIVGFEALSRWQHPTRGLLPPSQFLPLINELSLQGTFMIHAASLVLKDLAALVEDGLNPGHVSINMPEVTLATLVGRQELFALIEQYPNLLPFLTFEITEDVFFARSSEIIRTSINQFRQAGVRISLDDFGTGYASLQHLKELAFDELKLDTGFVRDLGIDPSAKVLIAGLLTMSKGLQVDLIAQGVETQGQRDMLQSMGCTYVQGYYFGAAMPFDETYLRLITNTHSFRRDENLTLQPNRRAAV